MATRPTFILHKGGQTCEYPPGSTSQYFHGVGIPADWKLMQQLDRYGYRKIAIYELPGGRFVQVEMDIRLNRESALEEAALLAKLQG